MPLHRERTDPLRPGAELKVCHRRWLLPDDVRRPIALAQIARLWRGLLDLSVLDASAEVSLERLRFDAGSAPEMERSDLPAQASVGALLAASASAVFVSQVVSTEDGCRDPYALEGESEPEGYRDYTLYAADAARLLFVPLVPDSFRCGSCGSEEKPNLLHFGTGALLDLGRRCPSCSAALDLELDKATLPGGAVFLLEELCCRAALSIELPSAPQAEELSDARVAALVAEAFGGTDELAEDGVPPAL